MIHSIFYSFEEAFSVINHDSTWDFSHISLARTKRNYQKEAGHLYNKISRNTQRPKDFGK